MQGPLAPCGHALSQTVHYKDGRSRCRPCSCLREKALRAGAVRQKQRCKDPTHVFIGSECKTCRSIRSTLRWKNRPLQDGFVLAGLSNYSIGAMKAWATKRKRYGENGIPDTKRFSEQMRRRSAKQRKTHCKYGHLLLGDNIRIRRRGNRSERVCRLCNNRRSRGPRNRPEWVVVSGCRVSIEAHDSFTLAQFFKLHKAMLDAHPDKGGTSNKFIKARKALQTFITEEKKWYASVGVTPPDKLKRAA